MKELRKKKTDSLAFVMWRICLAGDIILKYFVSTIDLGGGLQFIHFIYRFFVFLLFYMSDIFLSIAVTVGQQSSVLILSRNI